ncbi:hypothetical protein NXS08_00275 [Gleimia sp. 6138-11-ORH1]|uniref:hypothetical protein n=1 Tax=Gleimia sp. 6138-11-ORH1 TaxID=2973937 RepID=UPI0021699316|nr:hypothetical protein [Gleimia sp. 6138-11-ORH1]MCS4483930.1 hypothetical protein [Gleimia sp. 6138-11-ORH1]
MEKTGIRAEAEEYYENTVNDLKNLISGGYRQDLENTRIADLETEEDVELVLETQ